MGIDTHGHFKTWKFTAYGNKSAMQILVEEAHDAGVERIFDMPNIINPVTRNPVIRKVDVKARLNFARQQGVWQNYRTYVGATSDPDQLEEAAKIVLSDEYPGNFVPGIKAYMIGKDNQKTNIEDIYQQLNIEEEKQFLVYATLSDCGYNGVLALHCEKKSELRPELWDPKHPETHCLARPLEAELASIADNIDFARSVDFEGTLLECHSTSQKGIELWKNAKKDYGLKVAAEITPHHTLLSKNDMRSLGMFGKMNLSLRDEEVREGLLESLKYETEIPVVIGTDHAKHDFFEKIREPYMSGFGTEVYKLYGKLISELKSDPSVSNNRVEDVTYNNVVKIFGPKKCGV